MGRRKVEKVGSEAGPRVEILRVAAGVATVRMTIL
jgi:hypothetical protein